MKKKQWIALLLALALAAGLPTGALAAPRTPVAPAFTDISDPVVAESADLLRLLGIVNGTGGTSFRPQGTLTRAEFCKMAVELLGNGDKAASQMNRTIFRDVPSTHWARGYINAATQSTTSGETTTPAIIRGDATGAFHPDDPITFAEAVTILMRVLSYSDSTVGFASTWYDGYLSSAAQIGLTDGVTPVSPLSSISRGDAAILFANLLYTAPRGGKDAFLISSLGGSITDSELVLEVKGQELEQGGWALRTTEKSYRTCRDNLDAAYQGQRCKLVLDKDGDVLALQKDANYTTRTLRLLSAEARYVMAQGQEQILVEPSTPVYQSGQSQSTYGETYAKQMPYGTNAVFCYDKAGALQSIYLLTGDSSVVTAVATPGSDPFRPLFSATPAIYKNGVSATLADVKPYDVGAYDGNANTLNLSDRKLTGFYENAYPSAVSPSKLTLMGAEFNVLSCALKDLLRFKLGDRITILLDNHNNVAGVVSPDAASGQGYGVAEITRSIKSEYDKEIGTDENGDPITQHVVTYAYTATVELSIGVTVEGEVSSTVPAMERAPGQLVAVSSTESGKLTLSSVADSSAPGPWRPQDAKLGSLNVSPQVAVYDRAGNTPLIKVSLSQVTAPSVAASKITYYHTDNSGSVDLILLDNVTGDCYTYGLAAFEGDAYSNPTLKVESHGSETFTAVTSHASSGLDGKFIGAAASLSKADGAPRLDSTVSLRAQKGVRRTAFTEDHVTVGGVTYPLADNIDNCCYNARSKTWFESLDSALAYTTSLTIYYDRAPDQGGKVRLVVAE